MSPRPATTNLWGHSRRAIVRTVAETCTAGRDRRGAEVRAIEAHSHDRHEPSPPAGDEVIVWHVPLECSAAAEGWLRAMLSPDEVERAGRFHFDRDRRRYVVARAALRSIVGGLVGLEPLAVAFTYAPAGKRCGRGVD